MSVSSRLWHCFCSCHLEWLIAVSSNDYEIIDSNAYRIERRLWSIATRTCFEFIYLCICGSNFLFFSAHIRVSCRIDLSSQSAFSSIELVLGSGAEGAMVKVICICLCFAFFSIDVVDGAMGRKCKGSQRSTKKAVSYTHLTLPTKRIV